MSAPPYAETPALETGLSLFLPDYVVKFTMPLETFITTYGYPALLLGCLLEGGTVVFIAGALAHSGFLQLPWVISITFCCAFNADQFFFQVGRRKGPGVLGKWPQWKPRIDRTQHALMIYHRYAILCFRFIYGMRTIAPIVFGASDIKTRTFILLNLCSSLLWAASVSCAGYFFGHIIENILNGILAYKLLFPFGIAAVVAGTWLYRYLISKHG